MRFTLGIISPLLFQISLLFLYASIRYDQLSIQLFFTIILLLFPALFLYVLSPFILVYMGNMEHRIYKKIQQELTSILYRTEQGLLEETRAMVTKNLVIGEHAKEDVRRSIHETLVPLLTKRAISLYLDSFYSRSKEHNGEASLEYYEALSLFSLYSFIFLVMDLITIWVLHYSTIDLLILRLDQIVNIDYIVSISVIFLCFLILSYVLFHHSMNRIETYLPYVLPIMFNEPVDEQFLRRESIRSLASYNLDNLLDRNQQKRFRITTDKTLAELLAPLLKQEFLVTARTELARKLTWQLYEKHMQQSQKQQEPEQHTVLERLLMGEKIKQLKFKKHDLLGLNSDYVYIQSQLEKWDKLEEEQKTMTFLQLYRFVEHVLKNIVSDVMNIETQLSFTELLQEMQQTGLIPLKTLEPLNTLRYQRNQLAHNPGTTLNVSKDMIQMIMQALNTLIESFLEDNT